jgi:hypothetical protein
VALVELNWEGSPRARLSSALVRRREKALAVATLVETMISHRLSRIERKYNELIHTLGLF